MLCLTRLSLNYCQPGLKQRHIFTEQTFSLVLPSSDQTNCTNPCELHIETPFAVIANSANCCTTLLKKKQKSNKYSYITQIQYMPKLQSTTCRPTASSHLHESSRDVLVVVLHHIGKEGHVVGHPQAPVHSDGLTGKQAVGAAASRPH